MKDVGKKNLIEDLEDLIPVWTFSEQSFYISKSHKILIFLMLALKVVLASFVTNEVLNLH